MLCWLLPYRSVSQPWGSTHPLPPEPPTLRPPPTPACRRAPCWAPLWHGCFPLAICCAHGDAHVLMLLSVHSALSSAVTVMSEFCWKVKTSSMKVFRVVYPSAKYCVSTSDLHFVYFSCSPLMSGCWLRSYISEVCLNCVLDVDKWHLSEGLRDSFICKANQV